MSKLKKRRRSTGSRGRRRGARQRKPGKRRWLWRSLLLVSLVGVGAFIAYAIYLDGVIQGKFEGKRWALPARVYARPLELLPEQVMSAADLERELRAAKYFTTAKPSHPGSYAQKKNEFTIVSRAFKFSDGTEPSRTLRVRIKNDRIDSITDVANGESLSLARLDPALIASIYPSHYEDRILVKLSEVPKLIIDSLIAVEDRRFYDHSGVALEAIARAGWANLRAGKTVQGGSTLTQQLIKNYFLNNERTFGRKLNEAIMAVLLERHYSKDEILEAYLNELFLGQGGRRAIHGFGLASEFYFQRSLTALDLHQVALLVGIIKGPSYYDPRRHPQRARARRDLVLDVLAEQGIITAEQAQEAKTKALGVSKKAPPASTAYPAFVDLVRRQLREDYQEEDLRSEGLQIFTSLDPSVQYAAETALAQRLEGFEKGRKPDDQDLQGAIVVTSANSGEVLALVGDRNARSPGFNRALDAVRQMGSLIKPVVYLSAVMAPRRYTLATSLDDSPLRLRAGNGKIWAPKNYDQKFHGQVPLYEALAKSYNVSTVRLGMEVGLDKVLDTLKRLGLERSVPAYPSTLLGAASATPFELTQVYQTLAAGGFRTPLRSIRAVLAADGEPLQRYPLTVERVVDEDAVYLINRNLQLAVEAGTGQALKRLLPGDLSIAGKTGTTDDKRDSWFAGYTGDILGVVWVGRDDNQPMGLSGSEGALRVWADMMRRIRPQPLFLASTEEIELAWVDPLSGARASEACPGVVQLPFIRGSVPETYAQCHQPDYNWVYDALE